MFHLVVSTWSLICISLHVNIDDDVLIYQLRGIFLRFYFLCVRLYIVYEINFF